MKAVFFRPVRLFVLSILTSGFTASNVGAVTLGGQLGVLDLAANGGNNPATGNPWQLGDTYRLVFASSDARNATATDINIYNGFIQNLADNSTLFTGSGSWKALGATETVTVRDNTATNGGGGEAIFLTDGSTIIGTNYGDFWNGHTPVTEAINIDENGNSVSGQQVFTGFSSNGGTITDRYLDTTTISNNALRVTVGRTDANNSGRWAQQFNTSPTSERIFYGLSDPLSIVELQAIPEPSSAALLGLGGFALFLCRRK